MKFIRYIQLENDEADYIRFSQSMKANTSFRSDDGTLSITADSIVFTTYLDDSRLDLNCEFDDENENILIINDNS